MTTERVEEVYNNLEGDYEQDEHHHEEYEPEYNEHEEFVEELYQEDEYNQEYYYDESAPKVVKALVHSKAVELKNKISLSCGPSIINDIFGLNRIICVDTNSIIHFFFNNRIKIEISPNRSIRLVDTKLAIAGSLSSNLVDGISVIHPMLRAKVNKDLLQGASWPTHGDPSCVNYFQITKDDKCSEKRFYCVYMTRSPSSMVYKVSSVNVTTSKPLVFDNLTCNYSREFLMGNQTDMTSEQQFADLVANGRVMSEPDGTERYFFRQYEIECKIDGFIRVFDLSDINSNNKLERMTYMTAMGAIKINNYLATLEANYTVKTCWAMMHNANVSYSPIFYSLTAQAHGNKAQLLYNGCVNIITRPLPRSRSLKKEE